MAELNGSIDIYGVEISMSDLALDTDEINEIISENSEIVEEQIEEGTFDSTIKSYMRHEWYHGTEGYSTIKDEIASIIEDEKTEPTREEMLEFLMKETGAPKHVLNAGINFLFAVYSVGPAVEDI